MCAGGCVCLHVDLQRGSPCAVLLTFPAHPSHHGRDHAFCQEPGERVELCRFYVHVCVVVAPAHSLHHGPDHALCHQPGKKHLWMYNSVIVFLFLRFLPATCPMDVNIYLSKRASPYCIPLVSCVFRYVC